MRYILPALWLFSSVAFGYQTRDVSLPVTVGASKTAFVVSDPVNLNRGQAYDGFLAVIELSAAEETNGVSFYLQESYDGVKWYDAGDQFDTAVTSIRCASATDIANATETFTETSHGLSTGDPLFYVAGTAAPTGLTDETVYYAVYVDANSFRLASSYANALAGTLVTISDDGTGNQDFYRLRYEMRVVRTDVTDAAQLPLWPAVRVVADSGASDTATVSKIYVSGFDN